MDDDALRAEITDLLLRFIAGVVLHSNEVARQVGLGPSDSQFLGLLRLDGPLTPGRLAELTGLTTGTVTGVLDRLERGGFVRRERDAADRRKVVVTPVPEGVARLAAALQRPRGVHRRRARPSRHRRAPGAARLPRRPDRLARDAQRRAPARSSTGRPLGRDDHRRRLRQGELARRRAIGAAPVRAHPAQGPPVPTHERHRPMKARGTDS